MAIGKKPLSIQTQALHDFVKEVMSKAVHAASSGSLASFSVGLLKAESLTLHRIGAGMSGIYGTDKKHTTKQIDRFLTNSPIDVKVAQRALATHVLHGKSEAFIAVDWTEYDNDDQSTLCAYLLTTHGRALPLVWESHKKSTLKGQKTQIELQFLERLSAAIRPELQVVVMADRGFGYQEFIQKLHELGLDFVLRIRNNVWIEDAAGTRLMAKDWLRASGHARMLQDVRMTDDGTEVAGFVAVKAKAMKEGWFLVTSLREKGAPVIVKLYGKRFSIEETFRDTKNDRFGLGLRATRIGNPIRRDRLLLICALAYIFIVTLGQAGEDAGVDRYLKVNTSSTRQLSLFNQGLEWLQLLEALRDAIKIPLLDAFHKLLSENDFSTLVMNDIASMEI